LCINPYTGKTHLCF